MMRCLPRSLLLLMLLTVTALLFYVNVLGALQAHVAALQSYISSRLPSSPPPAWLLEGASGNCSFRKNISFLKTHKCASSALQNILFRYGVKHDLLFALPSSGNYFGGGSRYASPEMFSSNSLNQFGFNIYAIHSKWDMAVMAAAMPQQTVFVSIVREPTEQFLSLFHYTELDKFYSRNLSTVIQEVGVNDSRKGNFIGYNQMMWDFGMPIGQFDNNTVIKDLVSTADSLFHLVMVAERMPESLVLLRRLLCADLEDIVVLKVNAMHKKNGSSPELDPVTADLLRRRLAADYALYDHFRVKFDLLVEAYGKQQMAEDVMELENVTLKKTLACGFRINDQPVPWQRKGSVKVSRYSPVSRDPECDALARPELTYLDLLRRRQATEISRIMLGLKRKTPTGGRPMQPQPYHRMDANEVQQLFHRLDKRD